MTERRFHDGDVDPFEEALRALVSEIAVDDYRARIGSPLTHNTAYLKAVALLDLKDTLGTPRRDGD